ncbi:hypothetical protein E1293_45530 [Actinomadura darangshiensis]|uniref:Uncharacterized protein n=1 Tax=Actinomadura darangshiensis TaxID=705336 RepID=A0A4V6PE87_9ACTN|nr:hypothetical protein [Actinomadura darangshiensis]TDD60707.1 hypothetical protein E1293_45530 [Actinomadura darangshiensis]
MGASQRVKVARGRLVMWWWRVRYGHAAAEKHLDALADAMRIRGWSTVKVYVESPPVLWIFPERAEDLALSVTAEQTGGRWAYRISQSIKYPCDSPQRVAGVLDDVLPDRSPPSWRVDGDSGCAFSGSV